MTSLVLQRRKFIAGLGALFAAPAIVRASSLMAVRATLPYLWGDGIHDDTRALQVRLDSASQSSPCYIIGGHYCVTDTLTVRGNSTFMGCTIEVAHSEAILLAVHGDANYAMDSSFLGLGPV